MRTGNWRSRTLVIVSSRLCYRFLPSFIFVHHCFQMPYHCWPRGAVVVASTNLCKLESRIYAQMRLHIGLAAPP